MISISSGTAAVKQVKDASGKYTVTFNQQVNVGILSRVAISNPDHGEEINEGDIGDKFSFVPIDNLVSIPAISFTVVNNGPVGAPFRFFGLAALPNGIAVNWTANNQAEQIFSSTIHRLVDLIQFPGIRIFSTTGDDSTAITINYDLSSVPPLMTPNDEFSWTVQDDLSGLDFCHVLLRVLKLPELPE